MRGFSGRQKIEKTANPFVCGSYESAIFPPRSYRCHIAREELTRNTVMLPSIDADSVCKPFEKDSVTLSTTQPKPSLHNFVSCFVSSSHSNTIGALVPQLEMLNVFDYCEESREASDNIRSRTLQIASAVHLPVDLQPFIGPVILYAPEKLTIKSVQRRRPPRPIRRGAKVVLLEQEAPSSVPGIGNLGVKRQREDGDGDDGDTDDQSDNDGASVTEMMDDDDDQFSESGEDAEPLL